MEEQGAAPVPMSEDDDNAAAAANGPWPTEEAASAGSGTPLSSRSSARRQPARARRGTAASKYRGGAPPEPPSYSGPGRDPLAHARFLRRLESWEVQVADYLPQHEQALRLLGKIDGEAMDALEPVWE